MDKILSIVQWVFGREVPNRDVSNDYDLVANTTSVGRKSMAWVRIP